MTAFPTEHLPLLADAPNGLRRLRGLILELAVAGRLVPQDVNEECGSDLLLRIGKLTESAKNSKLPSLNPVELSHQLPAGWVTARLGDVVEIVRGITFPASEKTKVPATGRVACLRTSNVQERIEWDDLLYVDEAFVGREDQVLQVSDIVMSMANSRELVGKVALVTDIPVERASFGGFLGVIRPSLMEPRFVMALLRTPKTRRALIDEASQTTNIANISLAKLRPLPVAVPPLAEQHRIVAKVDELMALCDRLEARQHDAEAAHARLVQALLDSFTQARDVDEFQACWQRVASNLEGIFNTDDAIDKLKQAVLQLAVMGKLSRQIPADEPAGVLLERAVALKPSMPARVASAPESVDDAPYGLPSGWVWTTLARVSVINPRNRAEDDGEASFVPMAAIGTGFGDGYVQEVRRWGDIKTGFTHFAEGDIGVAKITPCFENSKACVFSGLINGIGAGTTELHVVRPLGGTLVPRYVLAYLKSPWFLDNGESKMTGTAGQKRLPKDFVEWHPFPLPPLAEQHRIVAKVTELLALCDQLKARIAAARAKHAQLAEALVAQAVAA